MQYLELRVLCIILLMSEREKEENILDS